MLADGPLGGVSAVPSITGDLLPSSAPIGLLVTCAVDPHPAIPSSQRSRTERLASYGAGLARWQFFERLGPIVVCEGSTYPEGRFRADIGSLAQPSFEYLTIATSDASARLGKGAAEIDLIEHALEHSTSLQRVDRVLKVTGRYTVRNGESLVRRLLEQGTLPGVLVNLHNRLQKGDPRVFVFSHQFFSEWLAPRKESICDWPVRHDEAPVYLEHVLARATLEYIASAGEWSPLPLPLRLRGTSGTTGDPYDDGLGRYAARRVAHWLKSKALGESSAIHHEGVPSPARSGESQG